MANYTVKPDVLLSYLPFKTEFDRWNKECFVSLVGFMFMDTKAFGIKLPFHVHFEEVNLRFYVKHKDHDTWKRGVVFIREIVPLPGITLMANTIYKEHYKTRPMKHSWNFSTEELFVEYKWKTKEWHSMGITSEVEPNEIVKESEQMFFTDQHWGYTKLNHSVTLEYEVMHPGWVYYKTKNYTIDVDFGAVYGKEFSFLSGQKPFSVFLAEGSEISLRKSAKFIRE